MINLADKPRRKDTAAMRSIPSLDLNDARKIMTAAINLAGRNLPPVAICIVDATGSQIEAVRMDGAKAPGVKTAHDKAVTAVLFERDTAAFRHELVNGSYQPAEKWSEADIINAAKINHTFCSWAGAVLVKNEDGEILGAVGVSGRKELEDDDLAYKAIIAGLPELRMSR